MNDERDERGACTAFGLTVHVLFLGDQPPGDHAVLRALTTEIARAAWNAQGRPDLELTVALVDPWPLDCGATYNGHDGVVYAPTGWVYEPGQRDGLVRLLTHEVTHALQMAHDPSVRGTDTTNHAVVGKAERELRYRREPLEIHARREGGAAALALAGEVPLLPRTDDKLGELISPERVAAYRPHAERIASLYARYWDSLGTEQRPEAADPTNELVPMIEAYLREVIARSVPRHGALSLDAIGPDFSTRLARLLADAPANAVLGARYAATRARELPPPAAEQTVIANDALTRQIEWWLGATQPAYSRMSARETAAYALAALKMNEAQVMAAVADSSDEPLAKLERRAVRAFLHSEMAGIRTDAEPDDYVGSQPDPRLTPRAARALGAADRIRREAAAATDLPRGLLRTLYFRWRSHIWRPPIQSASSKARLS